MGGVIMIYRDKKDKIKIRKKLVLFKKFQLEFFNKNASS
jgi:hypothetical protein